MLSKENRLTKKKDFDKVYQRGRSFFIKEMGVKTVKNNLEVSRFGFVVSLKVSKKAVERNKIKRRLREIIRENLPQIKNGFDCVVLTRPEVKALNYREIEERVGGVLEKLGLLK